MQAHSVGGLTGAYSYQAEKQHKVVLYIIYNGDKK